MFSEIPSSAKRPSRVPTQGHPQIQVEFLPGTNAPSDHSPASFRGKRARIYAGLLKEARNVTSLGLSKKGIADRYLLITGSIGLLSVMDEGVLEQAPVNDAIKFMNVLGPQAVRVLETWTTPGSLYLARPTSLATFTAQNAVRGWYNQTCVLTGTTGATQAADIFPNSIERYPGCTTDLLHQLSCFWPQPKMDRLKEQLKDPEDQRSNIFMLRSDVHRIWDNHHFCFRPLPESTEDNQSGNSIELEFI
ncbi:hypothetical protein F5Y17DRAFT_328107 [Xylariaceae sp. FL0594]|nr:hypothetical protein F5Y17DRAFT_328107 [Xylariaceae sp. FL0594]